jgi:hypothetical protein
MPLATSLGRLLTAAAVLASALSGVGSAAVVTTAWTESSSINLFRDDLPKPGASHSINLVLAKNEYESAQIGIRKSQNFTIQRVAFSNLASGDNTLGADSLRYQFVEFEHLNHNTSFAGQYPLDNPIRTAPDDFPDALSNDSSVAVPANTSQPIWIRAYAPANTPTGTYRGCATVVTDAGNTSVPVTLDVKNVAIPTAEQSTFTTAMWNTAFGPLTWDHPADMMKEFYGFDRWSPQWWNLLDQMATSMREYRENSLSLPVVSLLLDGGSKLNADGSYSFDWTRFDQVAKFFLDRHAVKQIEAFWLYFGYYSDKSIRTHIITRDSAGKPVLSYVYSDSAEVKSWNAAFLPALRDHVRSMPWKNSFWMHIADEVTTANAGRYLDGLSAVRSVWPEVRIADANNIQDSQETVAGKQSFLIPSLIIADENRQYYADQKTHGKEFWLYTANIPTGSYLNRFIDQPVYAQREMMWYGYQLGATGYLHWGYNDWRYFIDDQDTKGDGWIVKWDKEHGSIKPTIRLSALRDGVEDWELLKIVGKTRPALAQAFTEAVVTSATRYTQDTGFLSRMHNALVAAASGGPIFASSLTSNGVASASSAKTGFDAGKAIDGDASTSWQSSGGGAQWWQVDLAGQAQIDGVELTWGAAFPKSFRVQFSYDGTKWADAYSTTTGVGGSQFIGLNGKARYLRISSPSCPAAGCSIADLRVGGSLLVQENVAGGKPYERPSPLTDFPDATGESTDGVLAGHFDDGRSYGYELTDHTQPLTVDVVVDLQAVRSVRNVRIHRYEKYEQLYSPDSVVLSTSTDKVTFSQQASAQAANGQDGLWYDLSFPATAARYVKVSFTKWYGPISDYLFLDEIEAYA